MAVGLRCKNPGCIRGTGTKGSTNPKNPMRGFRVNNTYKDGYFQLSDLLQRRYTGKTIRDIIYKYAPPSDNNRSSVYVSNVVKKLNEYGIRNNDGSEITYNYVCDFSNVFLLAMMCKSIADIECGYAPDENGKKDGGVYAIECVFESCNSKAPSNILNYLKSSNGNLQMSMSPDEFKSYVKVKNDSFSSTDMMYFPDKKDETKTSDMETKITKIDSKGKTKVDITATNVIQTNATVVSGNKKKETKQDDTKPVVKQEIKTDDKEDQKKAVKKIDVIEPNVDIIDYEKWKSLETEKRKEYIPYNPSSFGNIYPEMLVQMNKLQQAYNSLIPVYTNFTIQPNPSIPMQLESMVSCLFSLRTLMKPIEALISVPIIGALAKPVVDLFNQIFEVIGMLTTMCMATSMGIDMFSDGTTAFFENIDTKAIKDGIDAKTSDSKTDASMICATNEELKELEEKQKLIDEAIKNLDKTKKIINPQIYKAKEMKPYTYEEFMSKLKPVLMNLGFDPSLCVPTEEDKKQLEMLFPNPVPMATKLTENINSIGTKQQYIKKEDAERMAKLREEQIKKLNPQKEEEPIDSSKDEAEIK